MKVETGEISNEAQEFLTKYPDKIPQVIEIGYLALSHVQTSKDVEFVRAEFGKLNLQFEKSVALLEGNINKFASDHLQRYFDPNTSDSYTKKMVDFLREYIQKYKEDTNSKLDEVKLAYDNFVNAVDFEKETSPLGKVKSLIKETSDFINEQFDHTKTTSFMGRINDMLAQYFKEDGVLNKVIMSHFKLQMQELLKPVFEQLVQMRELIAKEQGKAEMFEQTSEKGFVFEDSVFVILQEAAKRNGDSVEASGLVKEASTGSQKGDFIYSLNKSKDSIVIEAKDKKVLLSQSLEYMKKTLSSRNVPFGILVCKNVEQLQEQIGNFGFYNDNIIITHSQFIIEAIRFAKIYLNLKTSAQTDSINVGQIKSQLQIIIDEFKTFTNIKTKLTQVDKTVSETNVWIRNQLDSSQQTIKNSLTTIELEVTK